MHTHSHTHKSTCTHTCVGREHFSAGQGSREKPASSFLVGHTLEKYIYILYWNVCRSWLIRCSGHKHAWGFYFSRDNNRDFRKRNPGMSIFVNAFAEWKGEKVNRGEAWFEDGGAADSWIHTGCVVMDLFSFFIHRFTLWFWAEPFFDEKMGPAVPAPQTYCAFWAVTTHRNILSSNMFVIRWV